MGVFNNRLRNAAHATSGNLDTLAAGTVTGGTAIDMQRVVPGTLSATVTVDAETDTITISGLWQVSADNSTWKTCAPVNNAATVVLATGTAGADASVTKVIEAHAAVYGYRYARFAVQNLVATGAAVDTYAISYNYLAAAFI